MDTANSSTAARSRAGTGKVREPGVGPGDQARITLKCRVSQKKVCWCCTSLVKLEELETLTSLRVKSLVDWPQKLQEKPQERFHVVCKPSAFGLSRAAPGFDTSLGVRVRFTRRADCLFGAVKACSVSPFQASIATRRRLSDVEGLLCLGHVSWSRVRYVVPVLSFSFIFLGGFGPILNFPILNTLLSPGNDEDQVGGVRILRVCYKGTFLFLRQWEGVLLA